MNGSEAMLRPARIGTRVSSRLWAVGDAKGELPPMHLRQGWTLGLSLAGIPQQATLARHFPRLNRVVFQLPRR